MQQGGAMLVSAKKLIGYKLLGLDGEMGKVKAFYFDDRHWAIRYLVADTGNWLIGKKVLISPYALEDVIWEMHDIGVNLTKKQIEESPSLDSDKPVSRQFEESYFGFYNWPVYWTGTSMWGHYPELFHDPEMWDEFIDNERTWDPHLRSTSEVRGYSIRSDEGEGVGHVEDFLIDPDSWAIRYLIVDTKEWWPGKKVLISPSWIRQEGWEGRSISVNLSGESIKNSIEYHEDSPLTRNYEMELHQQYGRGGYWEEHP